MHKKIVIILSLIVVILAGIDVGFFRLYKIKKLAQKVGKVEKEVKELETKVMQIPKLQAEVKKLELSESIFKSKLPTEQEASIDSFWKILANYAKNTKCEITKLSKRAMSLTPENETMPFTTATFEANIQGNFYDAVKFVSMLENQQRLVSIESFSINKHPAFTENPEYTAIPIVFSTYVWKPQPSQ